MKIFLRTLLSPVTALGIALGVPGLGISAVIATSTFTTDNDGWRVGDADSSATVENPTYHATGGNPGGYISATDDYGTVAFFAPSKYLGNQLGDYGSNLTFDLRAELGNDGTSYAGVFLFGNGQVISRAITPPGTSTYTSYTVGLTETGWNFYSSGGNQGTTAVTLTQFRTVLSNLTGLAIQADWKTGSDLTDLDNVVLNGTAAVPTPEPASLFLLASGFTALAFTRYWRSKSSASAS